MGLLSWFFGSPKLPNGQPWIRGNGEYGYDIVGESQYQDALDDVCGGKTDAGHEFECVAMLVSEPTNSYDRNAVAVHIKQRKVGYLSRSEAQSLTENLFRFGISQPIYCSALVVGGWDRGRRGHGSYGVKLDIPTDGEIVFLPD